MKSVLYRRIEFFIIFIAIPLSFTIPYSQWIKLIVGVLGFIYIVFVLLKIEGEALKIAKHLKWKLFFRQTTIKLLGIVFVTILFVWFTNKEALFNVLINKPKLWGFIVFVYSVFSVYPQELIYRTFYFKRYSSFFNNESMLIFINAMVFSLGHIFFKNALVFVLTFIGGLLFATTFIKTKSTLLVTIEHAIYGCWLFTVGMGNMLGFPA